MVLSVKSHALAQAGLKNMVLSVKSNALAPASHWTWFFQSEDMLWHRLVTVHGLVSQKPCSVTGWLLDMVLSVKSHALAPDGLLDMVLSVKSHALTPAGHWAWSFQ